ncbi:MAG: hypothetical protein KDB07_11475, partial [Planctomycetes bacterium]|nr:hypothetical protein [Planctomycetota bacterium]
IREWFEADDKDLQRFRRLIEGQNLEGLRPVAPFSSRANSQAWTLHLAGTLPELGKRLAQFELTLGSVPNRATFVEGRAEAQVQSLFVQLGSSVTIAGAGAVTDTLAWSHFDGGSKEGALASQEWALKLAPGHLGFRAAIRHFHGAEAPHTVPNTSEAEPRETQPKETTPIEAKPIEPKPIKNDAETKPEEAKKDPPKEGEPKRPDPSKRFWRKS